MKKLLLVFLLAIPGLLCLSQEFSLDELIRIYNSSVDKIDDIFLKKIEAELVNKRFIHSRYEGAGYSITFNHDIVVSELALSVILKRK